MGSSHIIIWKNNTGAKWYFVAYVNVLTVNVLTVNELTVNEWTDSDNQRELLLSVFVYVNWINVVFGRI